MRLFKGRAGSGRDNISVMFLSTSIALIFTELTGVVAVLIDGAVTSRFLGVGVYSGISLVRPFSSIVLLLAGFLSTGCSIACSRMIGAGQKDAANETFNLAVALSLLFSAVLMAACFALPTALLTACGVPLNRYPELNPHMYEYLRGMAIGIPAQMLIQVIGPVLTMDNGKKLFSISSVVLCVADIAGDLLNVFVFRAGAYGMGLATSVGYLIQLLMLCGHFMKEGHGFRFSVKAVSPKRFMGLLYNGTPTFVKKFAMALRDVFLNYFNVMVAVSAAAIAARGIQSDLFLFLFCISNGLGQALVTMVGIYHGAKDMNGLCRLYTYSLKIGTIASVIVGAIVFVTAPQLISIYTDEPEAFALAIFSVRWMSVALLFDTLIVLIQHYLQGIGNLKHANLLSFCERMVVPVGAALVLGFFFGSKGILASVAVSKIILLLGVFVGVCIRNGGIPRSWRDFMFLPKDFGGAETDNLYARIQTIDDAIRESERTCEFCLQHGTSKRIAMLMGLFTEEMAVNAVEHNAKKHRKPACVDYRLYANGGDICFSMMDLHDHFDPTLFYELHNTDSPEGHIGIRMVTKMAKEVRYFSTFNSNNLIVTMTRGEE